MSNGRVFGNFGAKDWIEYYTSLNKEIPVDKCRLDLSEDQKKAYVADLESLKKDRETCPAVRYEIDYRELE